MHCKQNVGQNHNNITGIQLSESLANFEYLGTTLTNQNYICEEMKKTNKRHVCFYLGQYLSPCLPSKLYTTIILSVVYMGVKTGVSPFRKECWLTAFKNMVLRRHLDLRRRRRRRRLEESAQ
jgi:hypothetical protein